MYVYTAAALCLVLSPAGSFSPDAATVRTAQGRLRGGRLASYTGAPLFAFRGVRYAEPPTGDYRFKPPVPVRPWGEELRAALEDGAICPQPSASTIGPSSEDCLFLNVYTKKLSTSAKQPVLVYIHPGGYEAGTGSSHSVGPQYLLDRDVVLVTFNYRLGALGFLSTQDSLLPGNYGLKDQVEALKWVQRNIAAFGGDPTNVTLLGSSAGAASVTLHMVSPRSVGLFHRAVAMSGSFAAGWALSRRPRALAARLAAALDCASADSRLIYACLVTRPARDIVRATSSIKDFDLAPEALFAPVIEPATESDRFLTDDPLFLIRDGNFTQVPFMTGVTRDEFAARGYYILQNKSLTQEFNKKFNQLAPIEFMYEKEGAKSLNISEQIRRFYLEDEPIGYKTKTKFMQIYADALITFSVVQTARLFAAKTSANVYLYLFNYQGKYSHDFDERKRPLGVAHMDDLIYLFHNSRLFPQFNSSDPEAAMVRVLSSIWTSFASTGVPCNPCPTQGWPPLRRGEDRYLVVDRCPRMVQGVPFPRRMALWNSLFPLSGPRQQHY